MAAVPEALLPVILVLAPMQEIVYTRRRLSWVYYSVAGLFVAIGLLLVLASAGEATGEGSWKTKFPGAAGFAVAALAWLLGALQMWLMAKRYARNRVRLDDSGF